MIDFPLHPVLVHFTVALSFTSIGAYFLSYILPESKLRSDLATASLLMIIFAFLATILTITFGFIQFNSVQHDMLVHLPMIDHRNWAIATTSVLFICALLALRGYITNKVHSKLLLCFITVLGVMVGVTAFKGGHLVYNFGVGVKSTVELRDLKKGAQGHQQHDNLFQID
jgi:uncharacterized membrane protein